MSDRPTVSIRLHDQTVECFYMRNWPMESLLLKCADFVEMIGDASTKNEVLLRLGEDPSATHEKKAMQSLEDASEFPVVVDLTRRLVYLKDDYEDGHPYTEDLNVSSFDEYERLHMIGYVFPINKAIPFDLLPRITEKLRPTVEDGSSVAMERNKFTCETLPKLVNDALGDV